MTNKVSRTTLTLPTRLMNKLKALAHDRGQTVSSMIGGWVYDLPEPRTPYSDQDDEANDGND